jgi:hypothetical protein
MTQSTAQPKFAKDTHVKVTGPCSQYGKRGVVRRTYLSSKFEPICVIALDDDSECYVYEDCLSPLKLPEQ